MVIGAGLWSGRNTGAPAQATGVSSVTTLAPVLTAVPTTAHYLPTETVVTSTPIQKVALDRTLGDGVTGDDVRRLQTRLTELGFGLGSVDGQFGGLTKQAVWAYEKLVMGTPSSKATGQVTPEMWSAMQDPMAIKPRRSTGGLADHVEIYLPEQVMVIFQADKPALVAHISSGKQNPDGTPAPYCDKAIWDSDAYGNLYDVPREGEACATAKTPGGVFKVERMIEGKRVSALGSLTNPVYFNYGIAIHGGDNVPLTPESHGCIRISQTLAKTFQSLLSKGDRVLVWNGDKEPEDVTENESLPDFDERNYESTTTSSTTSTTTSTTVAPVVTTIPAASTTTSPPTTTSSTSTTVVVASTTSTTAVPAPATG